VRIRRRRATRGHVIVLDAVAGGSLCPHDFRAIKDRRFSTYSSMHLSSKHQTAAKT
jgi:Ni,Fe-hydrogenase maturation factor